MREFCEFKRISRTEDVESHFHDIFNDHYSGYNSLSGPKTTSNNRVLRSKSEVQRQLLSENEKLHVIKGFKGFYFSLFNTVFHFREETTEELRNWNQKLVKYVWFIPSTEPIRNSVFSKYIEIYEGSIIYSAKVEESPEEMLNEFQNMRSDPFKSLFDRLRK